MANVSTKNWNEILNRCADALDEGCKPNYSRLSRQVGVKRETLRQGLEREFGITDPREISFHATARSKKTRVKIKEDGNYLEATVISDQIKTLDEFKQAINLDEEEWIVLQPEFNKWPVGMKLERKNLKYKDGKLIEGEVLPQAATVIELWQIKIKCVRRRPIALNPVVQPVQCDFVLLPSKKVRKKHKTITALLFADPHFWFRRNFRTAALVPLHSRPVLDVVLQIAYDAKPDKLVILGDPLDMTDWSDRYIRDPEFYLTTQPTVLEAHWWLRQFRETLPDAEIILLEGNHERRQRNQIKTHMVAAYKLRAADELELPPAMSVSKLLALHTLGIEWRGGYPDEEFWLNDGFKLVHGNTAKKGALGTVRAMLEEAQFSMAFGHVHRLEMAGRTVRMRDATRVIQAVCPGCTCHIDGRVPKAGSVSKLQWQNGCALVEYEPDGIGADIDPILIHDDRALWRGKLYEARDHLGDIRGAYEGWNFAPDDAWSADDSWDSYGD